MINTVKLENNRKNISFSDAIFDEHIDHSKNTKQPHDMLLNKSLYSIFISRLCGKRFSKLTHTICWGKLFWKWLVFERHSRRRYRPHTKPNVIKGLLLYFHLLYRFYRVNIELLHIAKVDWITKPRIFRWHFQWTHRPRRKTQHPLTFNSSRRWVLFRCWLIWRHAYFNMAVKKRVFTDMLTWA